MNFRDLKEQGYYITLYAKTNYTKQIRTKNGTAFVVGTLSSYIFKHGYTNIKFKCFGDIALQIEDNQWIKARGILGYNVAKNQDEYKQLEIVIEEFEFAEQPPFKDYSKSSQQTTSTYPKPYKDKTNQSIAKKTELEEELFGDITEKDLPF